MLVFLLILDNVAVGPVCLKIPLECFHDFLRKREDTGLDVMVFTKAILRWSKNGIP